MRYVVFVTQPNGEVVELTFDELADAEGYADTRQLSVQSIRYEIESISQRIEKISYRVGSRQQP